MTEPAVGWRGASRWRALVLVAVAAALLAGCDLATGTVRTAAELEEAGIRNPNLQYDRQGTASLEYDADPNPLEARAEQDQAAAIIWRNLPFRIEQIVVVARDGTVPSRDYPRDMLEQLLGPRPADLDRSVDDIARRATVVALVVSLVVLVLVIVVIVLVVRAVRRRPTPQPAGPWAQPGPQPAWGQSSPPQQGWDQPPPPQQGWGQQSPPPGQQPWGAQPPAPSWPQPPSAAEPPAAEPPARGPGDTQRLEPEPEPPPPPQDEPRPPTPPA